MKRWMLLVVSFLLLCIPLALLAQQTGFSTFGLISPRGYEAKLTPAGALKLTTATPGSPTPTTAGGSPFDRFQFGYSQDPSNQLQVNADGEIHVTIAGGIAGSSVWGAITGTLTDQTDLVTALGLKQNSLGFTAENVANKSTDVALGTSNTTYSSTGAVKSYVDTGLATKQASLGFTAENVANKSTDGTMAANSDTLYSSQKALKTYVDTGLALKQATVTAGAGLGLSGVTLSTASTEAGFLTDGAAVSLTCGSSNQGKMQVLDSGVLEYCDGASTSVLRSLGPGVATQTGLTWNVTEGTCTGDANTGKLTVNGSHEIVCASDIGGAGGSADVTSVGSCTTGDCFTTGTPGIDLTLTNATSGTVKLQTVAGALGSRTISFPAETGTVCTTGSVCSGYAPTTQAAADGVTLGIAAFTAADFNAAAGVISLDYTNGQAASAGAKGFLTAADWTTFNAKQAAGSYATLAGTETLTNKTYTQRVTTVASSVTFACNSDNSDTCSMQMTGASGTVTLSAPTGTPTPMRQLLYRLKCTNAQTYAFNSTFRFSTTVPQPVTCAAGKTDYIGAVYNDIEPKWDVVAVDQGH